MNTEVFDGIMREMGEVSTRRHFFRLLGGAAALSAGVALGGTSLAKSKSHGKAKAEAHGKHAATAERRRRRRPKPQPQPQPQPQPKPQPVARTLFLSGGPNKSDPIVFDDDGSIYNATKKTFILIDNDGLATSHGARVLDANLGDQLRVRVTDWGGCRSLSPLWVHVLETGESNQLFSGYNGGRCDYTKQSDFLDFVVTVSL